MKRRPILLLFIGIVLLYPGTSVRVMSQSQLPIVEVEGWDTSELDAQIEALIGAVRLNPAAASALDKNTIVEAYLRRANVYYAAGHPKLYRFALGDFRRALIYQPENAEARLKRDQITALYESLGRTVPEKGNEPDTGSNNRIRFQYKPVPITMTKRKSSFSETLPAGVSFLYELGVSAGQRIDINLVVNKGAAKFIVTGGHDGPSQAIQVGKSWQVVAKGSERYIVKVSPGGDGASYKLEVRME